MIHPPYRGWGAMNRFVWFVNTGDGGHRPTLGTVR